MIEYRAGMRPAFTHQAPKRGAWHGIGCLGDLTGRDLRGSRLANNMHRENRSKTIMHVRNKRAGSM